MFWIVVEVAGAAILAILVAIGLILYFSGKNALPTRSSQIRTLPPDDYQEAEPVALKP